MSKYESPLNNLKIASPCSADWNRMDGDDRKRFCGDCKLNVYNLSGMTRYDAEHLLRMSEGRLCVRYFQRPDGTILTQDCPVGWANVKQRVSIFAAAAFSLIISLFAGIYVFSFLGRKTEFGRRFPIPLVTPTPDRYPMMGAVAIPSPSPTPKPALQEFKGEASVTVGRIVSPERSDSRSL
jgi:hypothetical protein